MFEIRPAALSEHALLPSIEAAADTAFEALDPPLSIADFPPPGTAADFAAAFHIMVAGRPPVGFVRIEVVDAVAHLKQLAVSPDYGRQGIGRALVSAAKAWARESGFSAMTLRTFREVPFNAPFCASCGFVELPAAAWGPGLRNLFQAEQALGLTGMGARMTMWTALDGPFPQAPLPKAARSVGGGNVSCAGTVEM